MDYWEDAMIETPKIVETKTQQTAVIRLTIPREQIREGMGAGLSELMAAVSAQGIATTGPWFTHHLRMDPAVFDFEIGVPVGAPVSAAGRVQPSELPAMTVARAIMHGDYEGLPAAWQELDDWVAASGRKPADDLWEVYAVGPESAPKAEDWRTELNRPILK
jgi:effector-binding domain-containing protein